jgi:hypothetical protein
MARNVSFKASSFWSLITKAIDSNLDPTIPQHLFRLSPLRTPCASSGGSGNIFMFDPKTQHVYEWEKGNSSSVPDYDLGVRACNKIFFPPPKYIAPKISVHKNQKA